MQRQKRNIESIGGGLDEPPSHKKFIQTTNNGTIKPTDYHNNKNKNNQESKRKILHLSSSHSACYYKCKYI